MSKLISGKEALIALANGKEVECRTHEKNWINANSKYHHLSLFFNDSFQFRLKPHTITINGVEAPTPFNGQLAHKQYAYILSTAHPKGYDDIKFYDGNVQPLFCWTDEDEIKQVVSALRSVFKPQ